MTANEVKAAILVASFYEGPLPAPAWTVQLVARVLDDQDAQVAEIGRLIRKYIDDDQLDRGDDRDLRDALRMCPTLRHGEGVAHTCDWGTDAFDPACPGCVARSTSAKTRG